MPEKHSALVKGLLVVRPVYLHNEERIRALIFCTMVALLAFALLGLLARRAAVSHSGTSLIDHFTAVSILVLAFQDGRSLCRMTGLAPHWAAILGAFGFLSAERYVVDRG